MIKTLRYVCRTVRDVRRMDRALAACGVTSPRKGIQGWVDVFTARFEAVADVLRDEIRPAPPHLTPPGPIRNRSADGPEG